ncbi:hypothetical protein HGRIS_005034 [Hohenbuehelia grisea]|uniref:Cytochrome c oxidase assembly protein n=1 Tax=Hohenbuehelia grisea TaxID=104357 RepID=A0ABR3JDZ3_9AGAR
MSRAARLTLGGAVLFSAFTIWAVHYQQRKEREDMYQGVIRDDERRKKMHQRQQDLQDSLKKREIYEQHQSVTTNVD